MAEVKEVYNSQVEADALIAQYEAQGWLMLHMDFDPDWKIGDEPYGMLTFTDIMPEHAPPPRDLVKELDELKGRVDVLERGHK